MPWTLNLSPVCLNKASFKVTLHSVLTFKKDPHARRDSWDCILLVLLMLSFCNLLFSLEADNGLPAWASRCPALPNISEAFMAKHLSYISQGGTSGNHSSFEIKRLEPSLSSCPLWNYEILVCENKQHYNYWTIPVRMLCILLHRQI